MRSNDESDFQPGDLLLFAGRGFESRFIAAVTCSPAQLLAGQWFSHVGICARDPHGRVLLWESTTLCDLPCEITGRHARGVQAHLPSDRLAHYDGAVWRLRLAERETLCEAESLRLTDFVLSEIGRPYDYEGAMISATWRLRFCRRLYPTLDKLFCSFYVLAALKDIGKVDKDLNPRAYSPARAARELMYWGTYQPLGKPHSESGRIGATSTPRVPSPFGRGLG
jgi:hypothetical protein